MDFLENDEFNMIDNRTDDSIKLNMPFTDSIAPPPPSDSDSDSNVDK